MSNNQERNAVVIYHDNCMDGFGSAWAFHVLAEKIYAHVTYCPASYGASLLPSLTDKEVFILDFSFKRDQIILLAQQAKHITILDHHKTAQEDLDNWKYKPENVTIVFDMDRSGAGITWDYFTYGSQVRPKLIDYIEDRDLWKFNLPYSKEINAVIANTTKDFIDYNNLDFASKENFDNIVVIGEHLLKQHNRICQDILKFSREIKIIGTDGVFYTGTVANCSPHFASDVGNLLAQSPYGPDFGATYHQESDGKYKFSLRSVGDYDVSKIAKLFGGGGHKNAAGFTVVNIFNSSNGTMLV